MVKTAPVTKAKPTGLAPTIAAPDHATVADKMKAGKALRAETSRSAQGVWNPPTRRADPVAMLQARDSALLPDLLPIRYGRMAQSPLAFLRGSAIVMAADLSTTPSSGIVTQLCGDAHLMNFGVYPTPERELVFGLTDFDETLPGPWEWDLKRLATSIYVAGRDSHFTDTQCAEAAAATARSYQLRMAKYAQMSFVDVWTATVNDRAIMSVLPPQAQPRAEERFEHGADHDHIRQLAKLVARKDGKPAIIDHPPLIEHTSDARVGEHLHALFEHYLGSLIADSRALVERYTLVDTARKVVGVGSVGTRCYIMLFQGIDATDLQFLQVKEAMASVLETYLGKSAYAEHGERVVEGQRLMQAAPDLFLGWGTVNKVGYYVRRLADIKGSINLAVVTPASLAAYGDVCSWALARAHARSGEAARISGYIGRSEVFVHAIARFAAAYADQTASDYDALMAAVKSGRIHAETGI